MSLLARLVLSVVALVSSIGFSSQELFSTRANGTRQIEAIKNSYHQEMVRSSASNLRQRLEASENYLKTLVFEAEYYYNPYDGPGREKKLGLYRECWKDADKYLHPKLLGVETEQYYYFAVYCGAQIVNLSRSTLEIYDLAAKIPKIPFSSDVFGHGVPDWGYYEGGGVWRGYALFHSAEALIPLPGGYYNPELAERLSILASRMHKGFSGNGVDGFLTCENYLTQAQIMWEHSKKDSDKVKAFIDETLGHFEEYLYYGLPGDRVPETLRCVRRLQELKGQIDIDGKREEIEFFLANHRIDGISHMGFGSLYQLSVAGSKELKDLEKKGRRECESNQATCGDLLEFLDVFNLLPRSRELRCKWEYEDCLEALEEKLKELKEMTDRSKREKFDEEMKKFKKESEEKENEEVEIPPVSSTSGGSGFGGSSELIADGGGTDRDMLVYCFDSTVYVCMFGTCYPQVQSICEYR